MIENLRELRLRAGLTQRELARESGICELTISKIEVGKVKPRELTWRKLIKALSPKPADPDEEALARVRAAAQGPSLDVFGGVLSRGEFLRQLKTKMSDRLSGILDVSCVARLIEASDFFSRQQFYPGDFATAVELLEELRKEWKRQAGGDGADREKRPYKKRRIPPAREESGIKFGNPERWPKKRSKNG